MANQFALLTSTELGVSRKFAFQGFMNGRNLKDGYEAFFNTSFCKADCCIILFVYKFIQRIKLVKIIPRYKLRKGTNLVPINNLVTLVL